jgi:hypothetical protein
MRTVGYVGTALYAVLLAVCSYRTAIYYKIAQSMDLKLLFHVALVLGSSFDLVYFISFIILDRYSVWGYEFHLYSLMFHAGSHSVVIPDIDVLVHNCIT